MAISQGPISFASNREWAERRGEGEGGVQYLPGKGLALPSKVGGLGDEGRPRTVSIAWFGHRALLGPVFPYFDMERRFYSLFSLFSSFVRILSTPTLPF